MIILDTNIVSELMKQAPSKMLLSWIDEQDSADLYVTSITIAEIMYGLHILPSSKRRTQLETAFDMTMREAFAYRILPFDDKAAHQYGELMAKSKAQGQTMSVCDGQIAAIALTYQFTLATRNIKDFTKTGVSLVDPFRVQ